MSTQVYYATCEKCGNDTFVQKLAIDVRGETVEKRVVEACEKCGLEWRAK